MSYSVDQTPLDAVPPVPAKSNRKTWIIVIVVVVLLCCCCAGVLGLAYSQGDALIKMLEEQGVNFSSTLIQLLA